MSKKILITVPNLNSPGGVSSFWNALLPEFKKSKQFEVIPLQIGGYGKNIFGPIVDVFKLRKLAKNGVELTVLNPSLGFKSFFRDGFFAKQLSRINVPFVVFFHGWDLEFEKQIDKKHKKFFLNSFAKASKIFVLSKAFGAKLVEWGYKGEIHIETTNVDVDLISDFSWKEKYSTQRNSEEIQILFLSRLEKEKGIFETIAAFKKLKEKYRDLRLVIAGDGGAFDEVKARVKEDPKIELTGHVSGKQKTDLFKKCHIYCLPSYTEGLPTSVLEAMAFGIPVITTPVGGLRDFFQDEKMGYLVNLNSENELGEKLETLIFNKPLMLEMAKYNHKYAMENLLSDVVAKRLYKHFQESIFGTPAT